ncbi:MOSC domain containing protein [[Leptolyngbya] sp. PCC 7376]|uniref:MOSC domain-containing protein n=1 Tax=[Leptolyngbya] sp. PCC 7376 TaxID=111781 RepID=UPI00029F00F3|nr:MOSC domain-containing protein [[Leptolyngbya] sp. PCC 7376]AFY39054.1 MOSC domain containing protein [[Leptolyngbya] sp. PCC 7376]
MTQVGIIEKIWIKRGKRAPMDALERAELIQNKGLKNNANQGGWRQVTLLEAEVWERVMAKLNADLDPSVRRANILVRGLKLKKDCRGKQLKIDDGILKILNETKPCERMDEALPGLKSALYDNWGGGAFGCVMTGGDVWVGASAQWLED